MLSRHGIELIERKLIGSFDDFQARKWNIRGNGALSPAHGTITATRIFYTVWQIHDKFNLTTMATGFVVRLNLSIPNLFNHLINIKVFIQKKSAHYSSISSMLTKNGPRMSRKPPIGTRIFSCNFFMASVCCIASNSLVPSNS